MAKIIKALKEYAITFASLTHINKKKDDIVIKVDAINDEEAFKKATDILRERNIEFFRYTGKIKISLKK